MELHTVLSKLRSQGASPNIVLYLAVVIKLYLACDISQEVNIMSYVNDGTITARIPGSTWASSLTNALPSMSTSGFTLQAMITVQAFQMPVIPVVHDPSAHLQLATLVKNACI